MSRKPENLASPWNSDGWVKQSEHMLASFQRLLGYSLLDAPAENPRERARQLFQFGSIVLAHDAATDPVFCYGNLAALELWEVDLASLLSMPSRKSTEPVERSERASMLKRGREHGFICDYSGIRISATGRRFRIDNAIIWNVSDDQGNPAGQAATFQEWTRLD